MHLRQQIKRGEPGLLTFGCWDPRVRRVPEDAAVSIPDLQIDRAPATIRPVGEVVYQAAASNVAAGTYSGTWHLQIPVSGSAVLKEENPPSLALDVPFQFDLVDAITREDIDTFLPTPAEIRSGTLFGIPLIDAEGFLYHDSVITHRIQSAIGWVQDITQIVLAKEDQDRKATPLIVTSDPAVQHDILDEPYSFVPSNMQDWGFLQLRYRPVQEIVNISIKVGDQPVFTFPNEWIRLYKDSGQIHIVPSTYASVPYTAAGLLFPHLISRVGLSGGPVTAGIPGIVIVTYKAGLLPTKLPGDDFEQIREAIQRKAAYDILNTVSDSVIAGIASQSISVDGVSQSIQTTSSPTNSTYGANMLMLEKMLKDFQKNAVAKHRGIIFTVA